MPKAKIVKYIPKQNVPDLKKEIFSRSDGEYEVRRNYEAVATNVYWKWVEKIASTRQIGIMAAREVVHSSGVMPKDLDPDRIWDPEELIAFFMMQFKPWQSKGYNLQKIYDRNQGRSKDVVTIPAHLPAWKVKYDFKAMSLGRTLNLEEFLTVLNYRDRNEFVLFLMSDRRLSDIESLVDDPIYGPLCQFEVKMKKSSEDFQKEEKIRKAALHPNLRHLDQLVSRCWPSNYTVIFPYAINRYHNVPNCLCMLADGSVLFRIQVLDPDACEQFELAELMKPWWAGPDGKGQQDFPFSDFGINPGDRFDYQKFEEVIRAGVKNLYARNKIDRS